ncbi:MAG: radical SAM protein [Rhodospirillales bacterium]|nr:radical SAM protein [Rhodospirillales bacterium]MBO6786886.1 radical SAM protein [Rhodospirillales bacterium]
MQVYSPSKFVHFPDHIAALRAGRVIAPVHVRIKPINRCNHACWYCAYRADHLALGEDMDLGDRIPDDKMKEIVADLVGMGVKAVTFSGGGEPLLYKSLPERIRDLAEGGVRVASLTNGSNLKGRMADAFAEYGTWIRVSLDAWDDRSYAKSRSIKEGAYTGLMQNLRDFAKRGSPCVLGVSFIIDETNCGHIADVCRQLRDVGVGHVKLSAAVVSNDVAENNVYHRKLAGVVAAEIEQARRLESETFRIVDHYHEMEDRFEKSYGSCPYLQFLTVIGADCAVYTCQDKAYTESGKLGSIAKQSFRELWESDALRERVHALDPSKRCRHHCVSHAKNQALHELLSLDPDHVPFV